MEEKQDFYCLYPVYIDSTKTIQQGRKFNKRLCVQNPNFAEIYQALNYLEIENIPEALKKHPRDFFRSGRFKINKMYEKKKLIEGLSQIIIENRTKKSDTSKKTFSEPIIKAPEYVTTNKGAIIENKLNLVARKKKDKKKKK